MRACPEAHGEAKGKVIGVVVITEVLVDEAVEALGAEVEPAVSWNMSKEAAHKSWPSPCFWSSVSLYLVWVTSNLPSP